MAVTKKYTDQLVVQVTEETGRVLRWMASEDEVSLSEVTRQAIAKGLRAMVGYEEALAGVREQMRAEEEAADAHRDIELAAIRA